MLAALTPADRRSGAPAALAEDIPLATGAVDAVFAGGLLPHVTDPRRCLAELTRVARPGGHLAAFRPIGRMALAAHHGRTPSTDEFLSPTRLGGLPAGAGWRPISTSDTPGRYVVVDQRVGG